jgi:hypothetical protein
MIRYQLQCNNDHQFETWFSDSAAFESQVRQGLVLCPECESPQVEKAIMAPNVGMKGNRKPELAPFKAANTDAAQQTPSFAELRAVMRRMREEVEARAENVGPRFAEEARKIHYEETDARGIYGEATPDEAQSLQEEGIEFYPLPRLPEDHN